MLPATSKTLVAKGAKETASFTVPANLEIVLVDGPLTLADTDDLVYKFSSNLAGFSKMTSAQLEGRLLFGRTLFSPSLLPLSNFRLRSFSSGVLMPDYTIVSSPVNGIYETASSALQLSPVKQTGLNSIDTRALNRSQTVSSVLGKLVIAPLTRIYVIVYG